MMNSPSWFAFGVLGCVVLVGVVAWLLAVRSGRVRKGSQERKRGQDPIASPLKESDSLAQKSGAVVEAIVRASEPEALEVGPPISRPVDLVSIREIPLNAALPVRDLVALENTEIPKVIGEYVLSDALGQGRLGVVHKVFHARERREVAMKFLPAAIASQEEFMVFLRERIALLQSVEHPNAAKLFGVGEVVGRPYVVMEYIEGFSFEARLTEYLEEGGGPLGEVLDVALSLSSVLDALHREGVPHGDLRLPNVMRAADGRVMLCEGAVLPPSCRSLVSFASPFMSESLLSGQPLRPEDDLFALGACLYMLLCLRVPYPTNKRTEKPVPIALMRPNTPVGLASIVDECVALGSLPYGVASELKAGDVLRRLEKVRGEMLRDDGSWSRAASMDILFSQSDVLMDDETDLGGLLLSTSERLDLLLKEPAAQTSHREPKEPLDTRKRVQNVESPLFAGLLPSDRPGSDADSVDESLPLIAVTSTLSVTDSVIERSEHEEAFSFDDPFQEDRRVFSRNTKKRVTKLDALLDEYLKEP